MRFIQSLEATLPVHVLQHHNRILIPVGILDVKAEQDQSSAEYCRGFYEASVDQCITDVQDLMAVVILEVA